jgi:hypothetical protein
MSGTVTFKLQCARLDVGLQLRILVVTTTPLEYVDNSNSLCKTSNSSLSSLTALDMIFVASFPCSIQIFRFVKPLCNSLSENPALKKLFERLDSGMTYLSVKSIQYNLRN